MGEEAFAVGRSGAAQSPRASSGTNLAGLVNTIISCKSQSRANPPVPESVRRAGLCWDNYELTRGGAPAGAANVSILLGDDTGHFSAPTNFTVGRFPYSVAVGDFNGDGKQDLAVANFDSATVSILLGDRLAATLELTSAASVKGPFAIDLPLTGPSGVEDRSSGPNSTNYRSDVSSNGFINAADVRVVNQQQGTSLP